jgi:ATP adenylyltransferase
LPLNVNLPALRQRFAWIAHGLSLGPDEVFDVDLAHYEAAAIIPTRGAFVPEWLLVVPRVACISIAELDAAQRVSLLAIVDKISELISARAEASVMFEHGPGRQLSAAGCGVDQAHLHVVGGKYNLLESLVEQVGEVYWSAVDHADPWAGVPLDSDYLIIRNRDRAVRAFTSNPTSQRLRRALADTLGLGNEWDYRSHPNEENACRTKEMFRGAFAAAPV